MGRTGTSHNPTPDNAGPSQIFHESTVHTVPSREVAYALCPASLTHAQVKALCSASSDFTYGEREAEGYRVARVAGLDECSCAHHSAVGCRHGMPFGMPDPGVWLPSACRRGLETGGGEDGSSCEVLGDPVCWPRDILVTGTLTLPLAALVVASAGGPSCDVVLDGVQPAGRQARAAQQRSSLLPAPTLPLSPAWGGEAQVLVHAHCAIARRGKGQRGKQ